jgi:tetraacyldisaccharide 4'-kinase
VKAPSFWWAGDQPRTLDLAAMVALAPLGWLYGRITAARMAKKGTKADIPVICVGNFVAGGSGKTPVCIYLAHYFQQKGYKPFFLSRGYKGTLSGPVMVDSLEHTVLHVGDEALVLAGHAPTIVSANRVEGVKMAHSKGADLVIMDDGFQNPSLRKDLNLIALDTWRGMGNGLCLPAGPLRAPLARQMDKADGLILIGQGNRASPAVRLAAKRGTPLFPARLRQTLPAAMMGKPVLAYAGIGHPDKFFDQLQSHGINIVLRKSFPDHHAFSEEDAGQLIEKAEQGGLTLVTTQKDFVRLDGGPQRARLASISTVVPVRIVLEYPAPLTRMLDGLVMKSLGSGSN